MNIIRTVHRAAAPIVVTAVVAVAGVATAAVAGTITSNVVVPEDPSVAISATSSEMVNACIDTDRGSALYFTPDGTCGVGERLLQWKAGDDPQVVSVTGSIGHEQLSGASIQVGKTPVTTYLTCPVGYVPVGAGWSSQNNSPSFTVRESMFSGGRDWKFTFYANTTSTTEKVWIDPKLSCVASTVSE